MTTNSLKTAYILSSIIAMLATLASIGGWLIQSLYRDNAAYTRLWQINDLVTLAIAVPLLVAGMMLATRGSKRGQLIWVGSLSYMAYNYAYYLLGTVFNRFFLLYVILFSMSIFAMAFSLPRLDSKAIKESFRGNTPVRIIGGFLVLIGAALAIGELMQVLTAIIANQDPAAPSLIFALDLSFIVPGLTLSGIWIWQRRAWGYILAALMLIKGGIYALTLTLASGLADPFEPLWIFICVGCLICGVLLITNTQRARRRIG